VHGSADEDPKSNGSTKKNRDRTTADSGNKPQASSPFLSSHSSSPRVGVAGMTGLPM
jgi:hypothetical protein